MNRHLQGHGFAANDPLEAAFRFVDERDVDDMRRLLRTIATGD